MESKGANINCFWRCDVKEIDGVWYQIPDLNDMKRAVDYVTNLATIGELRDRSRAETANCYTMRLLRRTCEGLVLSLLSRLVSLRSTLSPLRSMLSYTNKFTAKP